MADVPPEFVEFARTADEGAWNAAIAQHRAPDAKEQLRSVVAKHVPDDQIDAIMAVVDPAKLAGADGLVDEAKVQRHVGTLFGSRGAESRDYGQHSGTGPPQLPGDNARAALAKRHPPKTTPTADNGPGPGARIPLGRDARTELAKRYGKGKR
jgi:hypothetical protein